MENQDKKEEINSLEQKIPLREHKVEFQKESASIPEKKQFLEAEKVVSDQLKREIEIMELDEKLKDEAEKKAQKISFLGQEEKIEHLLKIAKNKGVVFSVQVAKRMNDPYILDTFHDILAKEGYYKFFLK